MEQSQDRGGVLEREWQELASRYLPEAASGSFWRFSQLSDDLPGQGWKVHVSATILSAATVLSRVGLRLASPKAVYKAPQTLADLQRLNCGLFSGFSQVGKFLTVYPSTDEQAVAIANEMDRLTDGLDAPAIPFERPLRAGSCVYYRYGAFGSPTETEEGEIEPPAIRDREGRPQPDDRARVEPPDWVKDPFAKANQGVPGRPDGSDLFRENILAFETLSQRGKGGVYRVLDLNTAPASQRILKEGRRHGETEWDGRDGRWRIQHEELVLTELAETGIPFPSVRGSFDAGGHRYLLLDLLPGENFQTALLNSQKLALERALEWGKQLAEIVAAIHDAGWAWRDCKPANFILSTSGSLRPLDFEGAVRLDAEVTSPWGTGGYVPPEAGYLGSSPAAEDLYALGATLHQLLTARIPSPNDPFKKVGSLRGVPEMVRSTVERLLSTDPAKRPTARDVAKVLGREGSKQGSAAA